ncbi:unnamed protein product [Bursaphelenchus okinawaensis]|uniref:CUB domain-containing protein n=1 Tax=Bursaphelenchus okinawaensis TaxID=465554 RepID=A0A811L6N8_9BILA|nr:unnamed protein product [Bursaphelenchus okinawaensis]CAG9117563.1 unnamed protein product [Bursaphelenchus okinawaensis]
MQGELFSPGYPSQNYPNNANCLWEITVPTGYHVQLNFDRVDIPVSADCKKDALTIYQEHQSRGKDPMRNYFFYFDHDEQVASICGIDAVAPIETESRRVRLNFTSNNAVTGRGFRLTWEAKCGTTFELNHGEVMSPFYPDYYPNEDMECVYHINPPTKYTQIVTIRLDDLELDDTLSDGKRKPCGSDYIQIIDVAANRVAFTACGHKSENNGFNPISIKGPVAVRFVSNATFFHSKQRKALRGFHLTYALSDCGGDIQLDDEMSHMTGTITSPAFPLPYHHQLNCVWNVTAPDGYIVAAKFRQLDLEASEMCYFDYVELWDGIEQSNATTWGRLCGQSPPFGTKMSKTSNMLIQFHSDETTSRGGFSLVLTATVGPEKGCGGEIKAENEWKTITPPMEKQVDGHGNVLDTYMNNLRCWWKLTADQGKVIEFKLSDVDLEQRKVMGNGSCYDFLAIYDGPQGVSPWLMKPACQSRDFDEEHLHYYSSYKKAEVYFETDSSDAFAGFTLQFRAIEPDCGGVFTARTGIESPLVYDSQRTLTRTHQRYKRCRFFIRGDENEPIELTMNRFSFPAKSDKCEEEFFEVSDVGTVAECQHPACATDQKEATNIYRTCGSNIFWRFVSKTSLVQIVTSVVLQSQYVSQFNLTYTLLDSCNRTITVDEPNSRFASGRVHSPNFPYQYDANSSCVTTIEVPEEYRILIVFKTFLIERGQYALRRTPFWRRYHNRVPIPRPGSLGAVDGLGSFGRRRAVRDTGGVGIGMRQVEVGFEGDGGQKSLYGEDVGQKLVYDEDTENLQYNKQKELYKAQKASYDEALDHNLKYDKQKVSHKVHKASYGYQKPLYDENLRYNDQNLETSNQKPSYDQELPHNDQNSPYDHQNPPYNLQYLPHDESHLEPPKPVSLHYRRYRRYTPLAVPIWNDNCKYDALRVHYNMTTNTTKLLCGFTAPSPILSAQNRLILNFTTDANSNHGGYDAYYYLIKTYHQEYQTLLEYAPIYEKSGVIKNVGYPGYDVNTTYRAVIIPPRGMTCYLDIKRYLNKVMKECNDGDVLKVGMVTNDGEQWTNIECSDEEATKRISTGPAQTEVQSFKIEFNTDSDKTSDGRGFDANWDCSNTVTDVLITNDWDTKIV